MYRLRKLLWMIFIFCAVFFIICDEKWYQIKFENNHIIFVDTWKKIASLDGEDNIDNAINQESVIVYKNSNIIRIYRGFEKPISMHKGAWIDTWFIALLNQSKTNSWIITAINDTSISDILSSNSIVIEKYSGSKHTFSISKSKILPQNSWSWYIESEIIEFTGNDIKISEELTGEEVSVWNEDSQVDDWWNVIRVEWSPIESWNIISEEKISAWNGDSQVDDWWNVIEIEWSPIESWNIIPEEKFEMVKIEKYKWNPHIVNLQKWTKIEISKIKVEKYYLQNKHSLNLREWIIVNYELVSGNPLIIEDDIIVQESENWLSDSMLNDLLLNDKIDVNALESDNDEFLQKVFQETRDTNVMNLIIETYLNEYQFIKAKRFVDNLPQMYRDEIKPSLNLRLSFNSFSLSSKTTNETLVSLIQTYQSKNMISNEDKNWYLWILSLMQRDYDRFFEIANNFTLQNHKSFSDKIQWYKDQTSKQMWMPKYYFDTLVALELFNQWLFQPAKVLALSSLQQNSNYILPYQILAYANFLTNSRDTSIEYLKKLVDLDPNNAEKYRFLMWIAYYWNEKYEQSVVMLSMIKDDKLRLDTQRYLINDYLQLDQKNKLISSRNKMLWYEDLVSSDFYTYFYETFFHPYSEWNQYQLYAFDTELADKMIRVCAMRLSLDEKVVCKYWNIGKSIALWKFEWLEQALLDLTTEYPQWYLYHALGEYYLKQWDLNKAKAYLIKAVSMAQKRVEINQIKKLLQSAVS